MIISAYKKMGSIKEASKIIGISEYALRLGIKQGKYPFITIGKKYMLDINLLKDLLRDEALNNMHKN